MCKATLTLQMDKVNCLTVDFLQAEGPEVAGTLVAAAGNSLVEDLEATASHLEEKAKAHLVARLLRAHLKTPMILTENGAARSEEAVEVNLTHHGLGAGRASTSSRWRRT